MKKVKLNNCSGHLKVDWSELILENTKISIQGDELCLSLMNIKLSYKLKHKFNSLDIRPVLVFKVWIDMTDIE